MTEVSTQCLMASMWNMMVEKLCSSDLLAMMHLLEAKMDTKEELSLDMPKLITIYKDANHVHDQATHGLVTDILLSINTVMTWISQQQKTEEMSMYG